MGFAMSTVKYILFIFNLLCALVGIAIIALGAMFLGSLSSFKEFKDEAFGVHLFPIAMIVLGSLICIIAFFGCCGAIRESHCMTMTYSVFLFVLLVLQIIAVVMMFIKQGDIEKLVHKEVDKLWDSVQQNPNAMDAIQSQFKCCGKNGPGDYNYIAIPKSCCPENGNCVLNFYKVGCKSAMTDQVGKATKTLAYVGIGVFAVELIGFVFACCLANHIRNHKRRSTY